MYILPYKARKLRSIFVFCLDTRAVCQWDFLTLLACNVGLVIIGGGASAYCTFKHLIRGN
jgi:hypothetical protein